MPRGRPKGTTGKYKPKPATQLGKLQTSKEGEKTKRLKVGKQIESDAKRYRHYSYNKHGQKFHTLVNKADPNFSFRGIPDIQYQAHLKRLGKGNVDAYDKLWVYGREGELWRMENSRKGVISRIENEFNIKDYPQNRNLPIEINGKEYTVGEIIDKLKNLENSQAWIDYSNQYHDFIIEEWDNYISEAQTAPDDTEGTKISKRVITTDTDESIVKEESKKSVQDFLDSLVNSGLI